MSKVDDKSSTVSTADESTISSVEDGTTAGNTKRRNSASSITASSITSNDIYSAFGVDRPGNDSEAKRRKSTSSVTVSSITSNDIYSAFGVDRDDGRLSGSSVPEMGIEIDFGKFDPNAATKKPKKKKKKASKSPKRKTPALETIPDENPIEEEIPASEIVKESNIDAVPNGKDGGTTIEEERKLWPRSVDTPPLGKEKENAVIDPLRTFSNGDAREKDIESSSDIESPIQDQPAIQLEQRSSERLKVATSEHKEKVAPEDIEAQLPSGADTLVEEKSRPEQKKGNRKLKVCLLLLLTLAAASGGAAYFFLNRNGGSSNNENDNDGRESSNNINSGSGGNNKNNNSNNNGGSGNGRGND